MDIKQILTADVLDIIFEGRNKDYGAYTLRKTYPKRILTALGGTAIIMVLFCTSLLFAKDKSNSTPAFFVKDHQLDELPPDKKPEPPVIEIKPKPIKQVAQIKLATPLILNTNEVPKEEKPPMQEDIEDKKIGLSNITGELDDWIVTAPAPEDTRGIVAAPKKPDGENDKPFIKVEIEASYPGGMGAWTRFLSKSLSVYPQEALEKEIQGTVVIRFIVDKEGNLSDISVASGPEELREAAMKAIQKSGRWVPAQQNGRYVTSIKMQPISFRLGE